MRLFQPQCFDITIDEFADRMFLRFVLSYVSAARYIAFNLLRPVFGVSATLEGCVLRREAFAPDH